MFEVTLESSRTVLGEMEEELSLACDLRETVSTAHLLGEISKMLQNIECELFVLDYSRLEWRLDLRGRRLDTSFRKAHHIQATVSPSGWRSSSGWPASAVDSMPRSSTSARDPSGGCTSSWGAKSTRS